MSSSFDMTRRGAMSFLGLAAGGVAATTLVAPAEAKTSVDRRNGNRGRAAVHLRLWLADRAGIAHGHLAPRRICFAGCREGIARGWFDQIASPSWSPTYLGAVPDPTAECNGVLFPVTPVEFDRFVERETGYELTKLDTSHVTMLDGSSTPPDGDIWYFANRQKRLPSNEHPIVQSYVDVCLNGCLEVEAMYPLAKQANFAQRFMETTSNWGTPWINDRIYPWRPFVHVPRASAIDSLIQKSLGAEIFAKITWR